MSNFSDLVHTHQIRSLPESLSVFPPWPLLRILCPYNVLSMDKFHRIKRVLLSVTWLFCILGLQRRHSASLLSSTQRGVRGNSLLSKTECQQSASQLQTKPRTEFTKDSRSGWQEGSQRSSVRRQWEMLLPLAHTGKRSSEARCCSAGSNTSHC